jgi:proline-specific peptidase
MNKNLRVKSGRILLLIIFCIPLLLMGQGQAQQTNTSNNQLPRMEDWFLSTGNWQKDPQLYVREFGDGSELIIMLHGGWGAEHSGLLEAVKDLKSQYRFIFYDQRGSLRSPCPDSLITFKNHIEDLELLRKELKLEKLNIVGHSMGAVLACAYAAQYPQRIKQLTLVTPAFLKNPFPEEDKALQNQEYQAMQAFLKRPEVTQELDKYSLNRKSPALSSTEETSKSRIEFAGRMLSDVRKWPYMTGGGALYKGKVFQLTERSYPPSGWDYPQEFKRGAYPVCIIVAEHDWLDFGNNLVKKWVKGISTVKLSSVKNAGHLIWIDQPAAFTEELSRHLKQ